VCYVQIMWKKWWNISFLAAVLAHPIGIWYSIGLQWNLEQNLTYILLVAKGSFQNNFFIESYTVAAWGIWKQRNNFIFLREVTEHFLLEASFEAQHYLAFTQDKIWSSYSGLFLDTKLNSLVSFFFLGRSSLGGSCLPQGLLGCRFWAS